MAYQGPIWVSLFLTAVGVALIAFSIRKVPRLDSARWNLHKYFGKNGTGVLDGRTISSQSAQQHGEAL